jgi:hypothetical protein
LIAENVAYSWKVSRMKLKCLINLTVVIIKWHKSIMW